MVCQINYYIIYFLFQISTPFSPNGQLPPQFRLLDQHEDESVIQTPHDDDEANGSSRELTPPPAEVEEKKTPNANLLQFSEDTPGANLDSSRQKFDMVTEIVSSVT